jgi:hypothetical protein
MFIEDDDPVLSVLVPIQIGDGNLTSSTVPENDEAVWVSGTAYAVGNRVIRNHRIYEAVRAGSGRDPALEINSGGANRYWLDVGPTNRYAMFDNVVSTPTTAATTLTVVLHPGPFNSVFLAGLDAEDISITIKDAPGGTVIKQVTAPLEGTAPADYWEYFYEPFKPATDYLLTGVDPYHDAEITVTLSRDSGTVKVGVLVVGDNRPLGTTLKGATAEPRSFSYIKTDEFGNTIIKKRKSARDMTVSAYVPIEEANSVLETLTAVLGVPVVLSGTDLPQYSGLRGFGLFNARLTYDGVDSATLSGTLQGLI